jgi:hypothetical protein
MKIKVGSARPDPVDRTPFFRLRLATAVFGVVAVAATSQLLSLRVDICGDTSGWWIGAVFISPLVFVGLCTVCATVATNHAEKATWVTVAGFLMLLYVFGASATLVGSGALNTTWC